MASIVCCGEDLATIRQQSFTKGASPGLPPLASFHIALQLVQLHPSSKWRHRYSQAKNSRVRSDRPQVYPCFAVILIVVAPTSSFSSGHFISLGPFDQPLSVLVRPCLPSQLYCNHYCFTRDCRSLSPHVPPLRCYYLPIWTVSARTPNKTLSASCQRAAVVRMLPP